MEARWTNPAVRTEVFAPYSGSTKTMHKQLLQYDKRIEYFFFRAYRDPRRKA